MHLLTQDSVGLKWLKFRVLVKKKYKKNDVLACVHMDEYTSWRLSNEGGKKIRF